MRKRPELEKSLTNFLHEWKQAIFLGEMAFNKETDALCTNFGLNEFLDNWEVPCLSGFGGENSYIVDASLSERSERIKGIK